MGTDLVTWYRSPTARARLPRMRDGVPVATTPPQLLSRRRRHRHHYYHYHHHQTGKVHVRQAGWRTQWWRRRSLAGGLGFPGPGRPATADVRQRCPEDGGQWLGDPGGPRSCRSAVVSTCGVSWTVAGDWSGERCYGGGRAERISEEKKVAGERGVRVYAGG